MHEPDVVMGAAHLRHLQPMMVISSSLGRKERKGLLGQRPEVREKDKQDDVDGVERRVQKLRHGSPRVVSPSRAHRGTKGTCRPRPEQTGPTAHFGHSPPSVPSAHMVRKGSSYPTRHIRDYLGQRGRYAPKTPDRRHLGRYRELPGIGCLRDTGGHCGQLGSFRPTRSNRTIGASSQIGHLEHLKLNCASSVTWLSSPPN